MPVPRVSSRDAYREDVSPEGISLSFSDMRPISVLVIAPQLPESRSNISERVCRVDMQKREAAVDWKKAGGYYKTRVLSCTGKQKKKGGRAPTVYNGAPLSSSPRATISLLHRGLRTLYAYIRQALNLMARPVKMRLVIRNIRLLFFCS